MSSLALIWDLAQAILTRTMTGLNLPEVDAADLVLTGWNIEPCAREGADASEWTLRVHFAPRKGSAASEIVQAGSITSDFDLDEDPTLALDELARIAAEGGGR